jgi:hypothetical protein
MPYTVEKLPDVPIILFTVLSEIDLNAELSTSISDIAHLLNAQVEKVFLIVDVRTISLSLGDVIRSANATARGQNALMHHSNLRENVFVATDSLLQMGIKGLASATFGQVRLKQFETLDAAMDYCRKQARAAGM